MRSQPRRSTLVSICFGFGVLAVIVLVLLSDNSNGSQKVVGIGSTTNHFNADRAFAELKRQVAFGPRPTGSRSSRKLARHLRAVLPNGRFEAVRGGLRNIVGSLPGSKPAILIGAHYDTKNLPGFVGANDGASGVAVVTELARDLKRLRRPASAPELRFVLFDGEESPNEGAPFYSSGLRGSRAYATRHGGELKAMILVDMVGDRQLRIPREAGSDPTLWASLRAAAQHVGTARTFPNETSFEVLDDHTPFTRVGVPAIDLIDFTYRCWHRKCDDLKRVSAGSLNKVGETLFELIRTLDR